MSQAVFLSSVPHQPEPPFLIQKEALGLDIFHNQAESSQKIEEVTVNKF
jgi:hypothetical protein